MSIRTLLNRYSLKPFLILSSLEGIAALVLLFQIPSTEKNAVLFGYSLSRIIVGVVILFFVSIFISLCLRSLLDNRWYNTSIQKLDEQIQNNNHLLVSSIVLLYFILFNGIIFIVFNIPLEDYLTTLRSVYERAFYIQLWSFLVATQALLFLGLRFPQRYRLKEFYDFQVISKYFIFLIVFSLSAVHWSILILQDGVFTAIPYWFWQLKSKPFSMNDFWIVLLIALSIIILYYIFRSPKKFIRNLILTMFLGYILQIGFGFIEGQGFESIRQKFVKSGHNYFAEHASDNPTFWNALTNYEDIYGRDLILGTKPPGAFLIYLTTQQLSNLINPVNTFAERHLRLTSVMAVVFPFLSLLVLIPLLMLSKRIWDAENAIFPGLILIFCPNFILIPLHADQFFYPLLFITGLLITQIAVKRQSIIWAFLLGCYLNLAMFFTFSMIPLIAIGYLWILIDYLFNRKERNFWHLCLMGVAITFGFIVLFIIFRWAFNYDFFTRYQNAFSHHRALKEYQPGFQQILDAFILNNMEITLWTGISLGILFLSQIIRSIKSFQHKTTNARHYLMASFVISFFALNIFGQTRGEVGRLWLFMVPLVSIFSSIELRTLFKKKNLGFVIILSTQLLTTWITYKFQDFY